MNYLLELSLNINKFYKFIILTIESIDTTDLRLSFFLQLLKRDVGILFQN